MGHDEVFGEVEKLMCKLKYTGNDLLIYMSKQAEYGWTLLDAKLVVLTVFTNI